MANAIRVLIFFKYIGKYLRTSALRLAFSADALREAMNSALLKELAGAFSSNRMAAAKAIREISEIDPPGFLAAALPLLRESALAGPQENAGSRYLLSVLLARPETLERLCDPALFSAAQSAALVRQAKTLDPLVEVNLARLAAGLAYRTERDADLGTRALEVLGQSQDPAATMPALRQLLECTSERVRSKAALLIGRISHNPQWAALGGLHEDPRVVANAVESLWGLCSRAAREEFRKAAADSKHRVAGNGAVGLYLAGDAHGALALFGLSRHPQEPFRRTSGWAMGRTGDPRFLARLESLTQDPVVVVREAAVRGLTMMNERIQSLAQAARLPLEIRTAKYHEGTHTLHVRVGDGGSASRGFGALDFVVSNGDEVIERYSIEELPGSSPVIYQIIFDAPVSESRLVKVELFSGRGCGQDTGFELAY